jgi:hypothetical protein
MITADDLPSDIVRLIHEVAAKDPTLATLDRYLASRNLHDEFDLAWEYIEEDWRDQRWPTFKAFAFSIWSGGYSDGLIGFLSRVLDQPTT